MNIVSILKEEVIKGLKELYDGDANPNSIIINVTKKEFVGDYTIVVFPFTKMARKKPEQIAEELGNYLTKGYFSGFNVVKGFLNLSIADAYWLDFFDKESENSNFGKLAPKNEKVMVEYSSPNTNKPLHLGHVRNILLGWSSAKILEAAGYEVVKTQVINDRGIHICKSMLAWEKMGNGETPESAKMKGDHLVGKYYVAFEKAFQEDYAQWQQNPNAKNIFAAWTETPAKNKAEKELAEKKRKAIKKAEEEGKKIKESDFELDTYFFKEIYKNTYFNEHSELGGEAKEMLQKWEAKDENVRNLWAKMNGWVYKGFDETYANLGVNFDVVYHESENYEDGKEMIQAGLKNGDFYQKDDQSVWMDLTESKLDHKLVLRKDGTSVYMTQDIGMAHNRYEDYKMSKLVYVVGDEQNYHFKVLFEILKRLGEPFADGLYHLSYGMVNLPSGKMKSREGKVVDADDLMAEVINIAKEQSKERGELDGLSPEEKEAVQTKIGLGALKYFILKVNPQKTMVFDPNDSVDMQGQTGPYIQNAYVRTKAVWRKAQDDTDISLAKNYKNLEATEREILLLISRYPEILLDAAEQYDPSYIAAFAYSLAKTYHKFWHDVRILSAETPEAKAFRLKLSTFVGNTLAKAMDLLGIEMPERM